jgi:Predicted acetyltransferase involved in intracellular survival and related acetyltransferases
MEIFGDGEDYIRRFYESFNGNVFTEYDGDILCGMVNRVPINYGSHIGGYIYAACTRPEYRGKGIFRRLLIEAETDMKFMMLIPAEPELYDMYRKLGYDRTAYSKYPAEVEMNGFAAPFNGDFKELYRIYLENLGENEFIKPYDIFVLSVYDFAKKGMIYLNDDNGFMIYETNGKNIIKIYDIYCKNFELYDTINEHESGVYRILDNSVIMPEKMKVNLFMEV